MKKLVLVLAFTLVNLVAFGATKVMDEETGKQLINVVVAVLSFIIGLISKKKIKKMDENGMD